MPQEIERKFLVASDAWREGADQGRRFRQAYLADTGKIAVRVRIEDDRTAYLTLKSARAGLSRLEMEYPLPVADAEALTELRQGSVVEKHRFLVPFEGRVWEVDVYFGDNDGLVVAEIELQSETDEVELPSWVGREVTDEARYYASRLAMLPYRQWTEAGTS